MQFVSYINFNGNCKQAFEFYTKIFNARIVFSITWAEAPDLNEETPGCEMPEGFDDKIMHAQIAVGDQSLMGSDCPPQQYQKPQGVNVSVQFENLDEIERVYNALSENADIVMPLSETFWAKRFAMLNDQFGVPWILNLDNPEFQ